MKGTPTPSHPWRAALAWRVQVGKYITYTRWFKVAFWFPSWRSHNLSKWSLNHPTKRAQRIARHGLFVLESTFKISSFLDPKIWSKFLRSNPFEYRSRGTAGAPDLGATTFLKRSLYTWPVSEDPVAYPHIYIYNILKLIWKMKRVVSIISDWMVVVSKMFFLKPRSLGKWSRLSNVFFRWVGSTTN